MKVSPEARTCCIGRIIIVIGEEKGETGRGCIKTFWENLIEDKTLVRKATGLAGRNVSTQKSELGTQEVVERAAKASVVSKPSSNNDRLI